MPDGAYVYFEIEGEAAFNQYSQTLAERRRRDEGPKTGRGFVVWWTDALD